MSTNFPSGLRSKGIPVETMAGVLSPMFTNGNIYHVDSGHADTSDNNAGTNPNRPLATLDAAVAKCAANNGDVILVAPGHAETINAAAAIDLDVAGITIVGLGSGNNRPTITVGSSVTTTDIDVDAADIRISNFIFKVDVDSLAAAIDVNAARFVMEDCEFQETSAKQWLDAVNIDGGAANACDGAIIRRCKFVQVAAGANRAIELGEVADEVTIEDCYIDGDFANAGIHNVTGKVLTRLGLNRNYVRNRQAGDHAIELISACTGWAIGNALFGDTGGAVFDPGSLFTTGNHVGTAIDQESLALIGLMPAAAVPANGVALEAIVRDIWAALQGTAANENGVQTYPAAAVPANNVSLAEVLRDVWDAVRNGTGGAEPGANKSLVDAIGFDGAAAVTATAGMLRTEAGTMFVVKKALTSSAIVTGGVDVTGVSSVGDILIEDVVVTADTTGLASGTNLTLETNNAKGATPFFSNVITALGNQGNISLQSAATTRENTVLESGKKVVAKCTGADCTGAGTIDVYLICRRLADNATLAAA